MIPDAVARFAGSTWFFTFDPGARAPGFMLTPASQAKNPAAQLENHSTIILHSTTNPS
ncbi:MAG TPA: hypothetical protein VE931_06620 [Pyrinomonadaceae bacterium]|nr:hypothetical protein [Pyrinomonadaceae bacterium]